MGSAASTDQRARALPRPILPVIALAALTAGACYPAMKLTPNDADVVLSQHTIQAPDPSRPGPHQVLQMSYGSGTDKNREIYRDAVTVKTDPVDASKLVSLGESAKSRNKYWGFTPKEMPLNARVWHPAGRGPFPILLIAHGNHDMKDFSDPGYEYLGELLASRGYIVASLDMNFINGGIRGENDARAWFFLKHLELWRTMAGDPNTPFYGRVDMDRIAIAGHSRGGEAVGLAAAFNRLSRYPDDGNLEFDFNFNIRSVIAIAPVDGQYKPADRLMPLENVNYLVFHGSHDGDVTSFSGLRQYQRLQFTDGGDYFKAAVLVYRANHGQWNTVWGNRDNGRRSARVLDLRTLMPGDEQRQFAKVYISSFLDATLRNDARYRPLFRDYRVAGDWLPKTMYINRFQESSFRRIADFEGDVDVTTGSTPDIRLEGEHLSTWQESLVQLRSASNPTDASSMYNNVVTLGWNNTLAGGGDEMGPPATFTVRLPDSLAADWKLGENASLQFLLLPTDATPGPRRPPKPETDDTSPSSEQQAGQKATEPKPEPEEDDEETAEDEEKPPVDLSVELTDARGQSASLPLSAYGVVRRPLEAWILRRRDQDESRFGAHFELVLQTFTLPLGDFRRANPALDLNTITAVRFVFDRADAGTVLLDEIGFAHMDPSFSSAVVR